MPVLGRQKPTSSVPSPSKSPVTGMSVEAPNQLVMVSPPRGPACSRGAVDVVEEEGDFLGSEVDDDQPWEAGC